MSNNLTHLENTEFLYIKKVQPLTQGLLQRAEGSVHFKETETICPPCFGDERKSHRTGLRKCALICMQTEIRITLPCPALFRSPVGCSWAQHALKAIGQRQHGRRPYKIPSSPPQSKDVQVITILDSALLPLTAAPPHPNLILRVPPGLCGLRLRVTAEFRTDYLHTSATLYTFTRAISV